MSIEFRNGKYSIRYHYRTADGKDHVARIANPKWTKDFGIRAMRKIEQSEIERDRARRGDARIEAQTSPVSALFTFRAMMDSYLAYNETRLKDTSYVTRKSLINTILRYCRNPDGPAEQEIQEVNIELFKRSMAATYKVSTINVHISLLRSAISFAIDEGRIEPQIGRKAIRNLSPMRDDEVEDPRENFWTTEEWEKFEASFKQDDHWLLLFRIAYWGGLRIGELLGLKASDFDPARKTVCIRRSLNKLGRISTPKTASSCGVVDLPTWLSDMVQKFIEDNHYTPDQLMFQISRATIRNILQKHARAAGVKEITPHGLRHSIASRMIAAGINPLIVSKHLRHSSMAITLSIYTHLFAGMAAGVMDKL